MRLSLLLFTAILAAAPAAAQPAAPSISAPGVSTTQDFDLPVSLDRIRGKLEQPPAPTLRGIGDVPNFKVEVQEKQRLEDLIAAIFKDAKGAVYVPPEGLYMQDMERQFSQALSENPLLEQPYSAFSGGQIVVITIENVVGRLLAGPALRALSKAQRAAAQSAAREEVRAAIAQYCAAQPDHGARVDLCRP